MREQQTLGRRIQEARKARRPLSGIPGGAAGRQPPGGEQVEADAAVPELENLIAMSRIFGVTIAPCWE